MSSEPDRETIPKPQQANVDAPAAAPLLDDGDGDPTAARLPDVDRGSGSGRDALPSGSGDGGGQADAAGLRPRPEVGRILAAASGGEGRVPSFADMVRHNADVTRDLGRAQRAIGALTVERDALADRLEEARRPPSAPDPAPAPIIAAGRGRWRIALALLALITLLLVASWLLDWSVGDLAWPGAERVEPSPPPSR